MSFTQTLSDGMRNLQKDVARSRHMATHMNPIPQQDVNECYNTARFLAYAQPNDQNSWKIDTGRLKPIAWAHRKQWDQRANAKNKASLGVLVQSGMVTLTGPGRLFMARLYSTIAHTVTSTYSDNSSGIIRAPRYFDVKGTYPPPPPPPQTEDPGSSSLKMYRMGLGKIIGDFMLWENQSLGTHSHYYSPEYCANLFVAAGLASNPADVLSLMNEIGLKIGSHSVSGYDFANATLGRDLHINHNVKYGATNKQALIIALIACQASFSGQRCWILMNRILITGAWPWLGRYNKSYAKTLFTAMICLWSCVRHGSVERDVGNCILVLARKLVSSQDFGCEGIRLRIGDVLTGERVLYDPAPKPKFEGEEPSKSNGSNFKTAFSEKITAITTTNVSEGGVEPEIPITWTTCTPAPGDGAQNDSPNSFLIVAPPCNHGRTLRYTGRIQLVSSLAELQEAYKSPRNIIVTKTFNFAHGVHEVNTFLKEQKILAVKRGDQQCISCAVKLGHLIGAVIVVA